MATKKKKFKFTPPQLEWLEALESGKFKKAREVLCEIGNKSRNYCCLGVACQINITQLNLGLSRNGLSDENVVFDGQDAELPDKVKNYLNMHGASGEFADGSLVVETKDGTDIEAASLVSLNDDLYWSHRKIAQWIRKNPEQVFKS